MVWVRESGQIFRETQFIDECISWLNREHPGAKFSFGKNGKTHVEVLEGFKNKLKVGLGYWDESVKFMGTYFSAVISKNITSAVHPTEERFFNVRVASLDGNAT